MNEENHAKKQSQSMALIQKLIRVDSKDCNFNFRDDLSHAYFKVSYQQTNIENNSNEALLRQFWHHIYAHYFKKIQAQDMRRLEYVRLLSSPSSSLSREAASASPLFLSEHPQFQGQLHTVFSEEYLSELQSQVRQQGQVNVWLKQLFAQSKCQQLSQKLSKQKKRKTKQIYSKLKQNRKQRRLKKHYKARKNELKQEAELVQQLFEEVENQEQQHLSEIDRQIRELQLQQNKNQKQINTRLAALEQKIEEENEECQQRTYSKNIIYGTAIKHDLFKDLESLEYLIKSLEEKQIAESAAKIISTQRANGQIMFRIDFEKAMNIEPKLITQKELHHFNFLRETSLIHFYRTGVKSLYSFICHNYVGFRQLMQNRLNITQKLKDKDLVQMMKKGACLASLSDIQHEMAKFSMCHHCKFLYQDHLLFSCKFASDKQAIPKMSAEASCDPNMAEAFQEGPHRNRTSQRFMTRKKNCLTSYAKIHDQYVCGRKYCFSCLKDSYAQQNIKETGLCPFCLGVCNCTRCLRNQKIAKFKSMYSILGGDLVKLQHKSAIEQLQVKTDEQVQRGRGRPKKYMISHITVNQTQKKLRRFNEKENYCTGILMAKKGKRKQYNFNHSHWYKPPLSRKKNDSGNDTQEEVDHRRQKLKRKVGRPRLNRAVQAVPFKNTRHFS